MCLAWMVKKFEFLRTQLKEPHFGTPNFVIKLSVSFTHLESFMCQAWVIKILILEVVFGDDLQLWQPQILSYFIFYLYLSILKISSI